MAKLFWNELLSESRLIEHTDHLKDGALDGEYLFKNRLVFEKDISKLVYSYDFRRLLGKTQVYCSPKANDYVRTRLVHALEVAILGRSLGKAAAQQLRQSKQLCHIDDSVNKIGDILFASCLCHDIGNPPFGHQGEELIREWFSTSDLGKKIISFLPAEQKSDFLCFEGNAQGLRVLTKKTFSADAENGNDPSRFSDLNLSVAVLGTFIKYPCFTNVIDAKSSHIERKKGGIMMTERPVFARIVDKLKLFPLGDSVWCRHPLTFLMEAADDICYNIIDLEDAYKVGTVEERELLKIFFSILPHEAQKRYQDIKKTSKNDMLAISYLRSESIDILGQGVVRLWLQKYTDIMNGAYHGNLLEDTISQGLMQTIKSLSYGKIYAHNTKHTDYFRQVVFTVLDYYGRVLYDQDSSHYLWPRLMNDFHHERQNRLESRDMASCLLDYFSGMTDRCAIRVYKQIAAGEKHVDAGSDLS